MTKNIFWTAALSGIAIGLIAYMFAKDQTSPVITSIAVSMATFGLGYWGMKRK
jgi:hypothetical protein